MSQGSIFEQTIKDILKAAGGAENIDHAFNCASRFRFTVKDKSKVDLALLKQVHLAKGSNVSGDQYQLIFGPGTVNKVMDYYNKTVTPTANAASTNNDDATQKTFGAKKKAFEWNHEISFSANFFNLLRKGVRGFANIFIPLIPIFIAGGFCLALKAIIDSTDNDSTTGIAAEFAQFFNICGGMVFSALPIFVGYTCGKQWGGNPWFGAVIGAILVSPDLINSWGLQANGLAYVPLGIHASHEDVLKAFLLQIGNGKNWETAHDAFISSFGVNGETYWNQIKDAITNHTVDNIWDKFVDWKTATGNNNLASLLSGVKEITVLFSNCPFFAIKLIGYQAQVFTMILVQAIAVNLEKLFKKIVHDSVSLIVVPFFTILISTWLAFWAVGPFGRWISDGVSFIFTSLFKYTNWQYGIGLGGALLAFAYSPLVITGLHQGLLPVKATLISLQGVDYTTPIEICSNCSQGIAALVSLLFITKSKDELRGQVISGGVSANFGITEPAIFGVTLQCKHLFLAGMIGAAFGGWWVGMTQTLANTIGISSWLGLVQFSPTGPTDAIIAWWNSLGWKPVLQNISPMMNELIALLISVVMTSLFTIIFSTTKWGKKCLADYTQTTEQTKFAQMLDKLFHKSKKGSSASSDKKQTSEKEVNVQTTKKVATKNVNKFIYKNNFNFLMRG